MIVNIIGCGRFSTTAVEILWAAERLSHVDGIYIFDDRDHSLLSTIKLQFQRKYKAEIRNLGVIENTPTNSAVVFGTGLPEVKLKYLRDFPQLAEKLSRVHFPETEMDTADRQILGGGLSARGVLIGPNCLIKAGFTLDVGAIIGHDSQVGQACTLGPYSVMSGGASLGDACFIEAHCVIGPGVHIPARSHLLPGTVVAKTLTEPGTYFGNPVRRLK